MKPGETRMEPKETDSVIKMSKVGTDSGWDTEMKKSVLSLEPAGTTSLLRLEQGKQTPY
jgi:hypothetical protein